MINIASKTADVFKDGFSLEMWGGATFDVARPKENPWERLNVYVKLFQMYYSKMSLRASNAVGYKNYPDNVIHKFVQESAKATRP